MKNSVPFPQRKLSFLHIAMLLMVQSVWRLYRKQTRRQRREKRAGAAILRICDTEETLSSLNSLLQHFSWREWQNVDIQLVYVCEDISLRNRSHSYPSAMQHSQYYYYTSVITNTSSAKTTSNTVLLLLTSLSTLQKNKINGINITNMHKKSTQ